MHRWLIPCVYLWMYMCLCVCNCEGLHVWANINASGGVCLNCCVERSMSTCMCKLPVSLCVQAQLYSPLWKNACIHVYCISLGEGGGCVSCVGEWQSVTGGAVSQPSYFTVSAEAISRNGCCQFVVLLIDVRAVSLESGTEAVKWNFQTSPDRRKLSWVCKVIENRYF